MKNTVKNILFTAVLGATIYFCIKYPKNINEAVSSAVIRCFEFIIPSMFIFMCLSCIILNSKIAQWLVSPLSFFYKNILRLDSRGFSIFLISMISGYPTGIKLIYDSLDKNLIEASQAKRMSTFCFSSGPAFISAVSAVLFPDTNVSLLLFLSVTSGNIAAALFTAVGEPLPETVSQKPRINLSASCITDSVKSAAGAVYQMCVMIVFFAGISEMLKLSGITQKAAFMLERLTGAPSAEVLEAFMEISSITTLPCNPNILPGAAALLSFGGICVLLQLAAISKGRICIGNFLLMRVFSAFVSSLICSLLMKTFDFGINVTAFSYSFTENKQYFPVPSVFIIIMTLLLLSLFKKTGHKSNKML